MNLEAIAELEAAHPGVELIFSRERPRQPGGVQSRDGPFVFTNLKTSTGLDQVFAWMEERRSHGLTASGTPVSKHHHHHAAH